MKTKIAITTLTLAVIALGVWVYTLNRALEKQTTISVVVDGATTTIPVATALQNYALNSTESVRFLGEALYAAGIIVSDGTKLIINPELTQNPAP